MLFTPELSNKPGAGNLPVTLRRPLIDSESFGDFTMGEPSETPVLQNLGHAGLLGGQALQQAIYIQSIQPGITHMHVYRIQLQLTDAAAALFRIVGAGMVNQ